MHARRRNHRAPVPVSCRGTTEDHVVPIARPSVPRDRRSVLRYRQALACERRLRRLQRGRLDQPRVGRHGVALFDEYEVAGHKLARQDALSGAVPYDVGVRCRHLAQRRHRLLGASLLKVSHEPVEEDDGEDRHSFVGYRGVALIKPQTCGDERGKDQQDDEDIRELAQKLSPSGH